MTCYQAWWVLCACTLLITSCQKDDLSPDNNFVNFKSPQVGQQSRFVLFKGEDYKSNTNFDFTYTNDTLVIEVLEKKSDGYYVREFLSPGSASLNGQNNVAFADLEIYYFLEKNGNLIRIKYPNFRQNSRLFLFPSEFGGTINLEETVDPQVEVKGWKTNLPYSTGYVEAATSLDLFGKSYKNLNFMMDNRPMKQRGSGITHIYNKDYGMVRVSEYSSLTGKGYGWDLLPN